MLAVSGGAGVIWARGRATPTCRLAPLSGRRGAVTLVAAALPLALAIRSAPLIAYWRDVVRLAAEYRVWESANGPAALVFVPAMGVLLVPALEAVAAVVVALSCVCCWSARRGSQRRRPQAVGDRRAAGRRADVPAAGWASAPPSGWRRCVETLIRDTADAGGQEQARALALLSGTVRRRPGARGTLAWAWAAMVLLALGTRAVAAAGAGTPWTSTQRPRCTVSTRLRARALLDAPIACHRTTPPVRRF